jgi:hypothetical protein
MSDSISAGSGAPAAPISVGAVVKRSFSTLFANIVPFGVLALVLSLPGLFYNLSTVDETLAGLEPSFSTGEIVALIAMIVLAYVLMGAVVYGTISHLRGGKPGMGQIVARGFAVALPVIVIAIAFSIIMTIGMMLLVVPGIFVIVVFAVTVPAYVVEKPGIVGSFRRSWNLTKGNRWRVLGILVILMVILAIVGMVIGAAAGFSVVMGTDLTFVLIVNYVVSAFSAALMSVAIAVMYHDLRVAKEGVSTAQIAAVFD